MFPNIRTVLKEGQTGSCGHRKNGELVFKTNKRNYTRSLRLSEFFYCEVVTSKVMVILTINDLFLYNVSLVTLLNTGVFLRMLQIVRTNRCETRTPLYLFSTFNCLLGSQYF